MKKTIIGFLLILSGCASVNNQDLERPYSLGEKRDLEKIIEERRKAQEQKNETAEEPEVTSKGEEKEAVEQISLLPSDSNKLQDEEVTVDESKNDSNEEDYNGLSNNTELKEMLSQLRDDYSRQKKQIESLSKTEREIIRTRFEQEVNRINKDRELELRKINLEYDYIAQGIEKDYKKELSAIDSEESKILRDLELEYERSVLEQEEKFISDYIFNFGTDIGDNDGVN